MASRLFESVIASSVLLLGAVGAEACASSVDHSRDDAGDVQVAEPDDASLGDDAIDAAVDAALTDARSQEAGWPTTKGATCVRDPLVGPAFCCRSGPDGYCWTPTEADGSGPLCIPDMTMRAACTPCDPMSENRACQRPDVTVSDAASEEAGGG